DDLEAELEATRRERDRANALAARSRELEAEVALLRERVARAEGIGMHGTHRATVAWGGLFITILGAIGLGAVLHAREQRQREEFGLEVERQIAEQSSNVKPIDDTPAAAPTAHEPEATTIIEAKWQAKVKQATGMSLAPGASCTIT